MINLNGSGSRVLSIVVDDYVQTSHKKKQINRVHGIFKNLKVSLTLDCKSNIFANRKKLVSKFNELYEFCCDNGIETIVDHALPLCFVYGTKIPLMKKGSLCSCECAGLIDPQFNIKFCNLSFGNSLNLYKDGRLIPFKIIENFISLEFYEKQTTVLKDM